MGLKRIIRPELFEFIDSRICHVGGPAIELFVECLETFVGIRETDGENNGHFVNLIQSTVDQANREPWCVSMVQSAIAYVEQKLNVRCLLPATEHALTLYNAAKDLGLVDHTPARGDIVVWQFGMSNSGHVGVVIKSGDVIETIEGNTGPSHEVIREGDGVFKKLRYRQGSNQMRLKGYITVKFNQDKALA